MRWPQTPAPSARPSHGTTAGCPGRMCARAATHEQSSSAGAAMIRWASRIAVTGALIQIGYGALACVFGYPTISDRPFEALWVLANVGMIANIAVWLSIKVATPRLARRRYVARQAATRPAGPGAAVRPGRRPRRGAVLLIRQGRALHPARPVVGRHLAVHGAGRPPAPQRRSRAGHRHRGAGPPGADNA